MIYPGLTVLRPKPKTAIPKSAIRNEPMIRTLRSACRIAGVYTSAPVVACSERLGLMVRCFRNGIRIGTQRPSDQFFAYAASRLRCRKAFRTPRPIFTFMAADIGFDMRAGAEVPLALEPLPFARMAMALSMRPSSSASSLRLLFNVEITSFIRWCLH